jgi:hypothetical protein
MATLRGLLLNRRAQRVTESLSVTLFEAVVAPVSSERHGFPLVFHHFHQFESATSSRSWGATDPTNDPLWRPTSPSVTPSHLFRGPCGYPGASPGRLWVRLFSGPDPRGCGGNVGFYSISVCARRGSVLDLIFSCPQSSHKVLRSTYGYPSGSLAKQKSPKGPQVTFSNSF